MGLKLSLLPPAPQSLFQVLAMAPMKAMKAMKAAKAGAVMTKGGLAAALAEATEVKPAVARKMLESLAEVATKEVKKGKFTIPGLCMIKTRVKPATKAGKREVFGKVTMVKAKPARKVVKAFPVKALKDSV